MAYLDNVAAIRRIHRNYKGVVCRIVHHNEADNIEMKDSRRATTRDAGHKTLVGNKASVGTATVSDNYVSDTPANFDTDFELGV